jgi:hypothetical protein
MNIVSGSTFASRGSSFVANNFIKAGDIISINNEIRSVISSNTNGFVANAVYTTSANTVYALRKLNVVDANVITISGRTIGTNVSIINSDANTLVYFIVPDYKRDYSYFFTTLAE